MVPAIGGTRTVPAPDSIATAYLLLALRVEQRIPGLVDGYFGPAALKAQVDMEQLPSPPRLREDAVALRERVAHEVAEPDRRAWLDAQLVALEAHAAALTGAPLPYVEHLARCVGFAPARRDVRTFDAARAAIADLLPGDAPLADRVAAWDRTLEIPVDRLLAVFDWLVARFRAGAARDFGLPDDEDVHVSLVTDQPWAVYHSFDGGGRSRVDVNTDLPMRAPWVARMVAHATYPGHHLERAWKEADLVDGMARLEASVVLLATPERIVSEGLADLAGSFAIQPEDEADLLMELFERAGLTIAADAAAARAMAQLCVALRPALRTLDATRAEAAFLRHADGGSSDDALAYLRDIGNFGPDQAAKSLALIEHPLWRTCASVDAEGEGLVRRWVEAVPPNERKERFGRLLHEELTPAAILDETASAALPDGPGRSA